MDSFESSNFTLPASGSQLLSVSPLFPSSSNTGPGGDDLSLSELSPSYHAKPGPLRKRFSLFARPRDEESLDIEDADDLVENTIRAEVEAGEDEGEGEDEEVVVERERRVVTRTREEKLQHDLFILRKLNESFAVYNEALAEAKTATEKVSAQVRETNVLLDRYVGLLSRSDEISRLIFDEKWNGADMDQEIIEQEEREAEEKARREEEERALAEQRELERLEKEEQERAAREERERLERETKVKPVGRGSGVTGVRGTRASMRGMRASTGGNRPTSVASSTTSSGGRIPTKPRGASTTARGTGIARGVPRRS
ncbi:hypothetical protein JAAARDRAFT_58075 [Jaapia argillacea MUCL 33604]|uniref:DASH complex subunit DUO1 n=1 Tax=Jaapia argillacea MUCL 33604 TaxID=933084 RepID=A0A067PRM2_9AGAM|nr:hypothetical protein JAAARDRAFT_58075 [Jaapia argillacea MUCL 33604]